LGPRSPLLAAEDPQMPQPITVDKAVIMAERIVVAG
jgi:hypothetical protein